MQKVDYSELGRLSALTPIVQCELPEDAESVNGEEAIILPEDRASLKDVLKVLNQDFFYALLDGAPMYAGIKTPHQGSF